MNKKRLGTAIISLASFVFLACESGPVKLEDPPKSFKDAGENTIFSEGRVVKVHKKSPENPMVRGLCFISSQPKSFFEVPCKQINLVLTSADNQEVLNEKTDDVGRFFFQVKKGVSYTLSVNSKRYKTDYETIKVSAGSELLIRLVAK